MNENNQMQFNQWKCEHCGLINSDINLCCPNCGKLITNDKAERNLSLVAEIILYAGIVISAILLLIGIYLFFDKEITKSIHLLIAIIPTICLTIIPYSIMKVICKISYQLRDINNNLNK